MVDSQSRAILEIFGESLIGMEDSAPLREAFNKVAAMLQREDQGWSLLFGGGFNEDDEQYGLKLEHLKEWGAKIDEAIIGAPWIGKGFRLRADFVWKDGIRYGNIPGATGGTRGKRNVHDVIQRPENQFHFFGPIARRKREKNLYSKGIAFWIGDEATGNLEAVPLWQITDEFKEPNGLGYAWAYKREWSEYNLRTGKSEKQTRWYFTDQWVSKRVKTIAPPAKDGTAGKPDPVDQTHVIFDQIANATEGLVYGAPDALAAFVWNGIARDAYMDGRTMTQALASLAFKLSIKGKDAGQTGAIALASPHGAGSTFVAGQANDLSMMANAGKAYDFGSLRALVAVVASALDVSVIALTANPGDAGSSYGASQVLDLPSRLAMQSRRDEHIELDKRVLRWLGVQEPDVTFVPFDGGDEVYREIQSVAMELQNDLVSRQEARDFVDDLKGRPNGKVPTEEQRPSVLNAKTMAKIGAQVTTTDPNKVGDGVTKATTSNKTTTTAPQTASPNQGRSNGTGGQGGGNASNDIRRGGK